MCLVRPVKLANQKQEKIVAFETAAVDIASRQFEFGLMRGRAGVLVTIAPENERKAIEERDEAVGKRYGNRNIID